MAAAKNLLALQLLQLLPHLVVSHHIPGRIRLKVRHSGLPLVNSMDLHDLTRALPGILHLRVNAFARSVIVEYQPQVLPYAWWEELAALKDHPERAEHLVLCQAGMVTP